MQTTERIVYTTNEVATMLGVTRQTVYNLLAKGTLKKINITGAKKGGTRILKSDFEEYMKACKEGN